MSSADLVQANGMGSSFQSLIQSRMSFSSAGTDWWAPRRSCLSVNSANHRSIWLSQDSLPRVRVHNVGHHICARSGRCCTGSASTERNRRSHNCASNARAAATRAALDGAVHARIVDSADLTGI
jgi:hypothetical protein